MKRKGILNAELIRAIAELGHKDQLVICDSGLPIPEGVTRIDLALSRGIPTFMEVLEEVLNETIVEEAIIAEEMKEESPELHKKVLDILQEIPVEYINHIEFKEMTTDAKTVVRSGEVIPYANIILISGVNF